MLSFTSAQKMHLNDLLHICLNIRNYKLEDKYITSDQINIFNACKNDMLLDLRVFLSAITDSMYHIQKDVFLVYNPKYNSLGDIDLFGSLLAVDTSISTFITLCANMNTIVEAAVKKHKMDRYISITPIEEKIYILHSYIVDIVDIFNVHIVPLVDKIQKYKNSL